MVKMVITLNINIALDCMLGGQPHQGLQFCFSCTLAGWTSDSLWLSLYERVGAWRGVFGQAHTGVTVGFLSLWFSVIVLSLFLYFIPFLYHILYVLWDDAPISYESSLRTKKLYLDPLQN